MQLAGKILIFGALVIYSCGENPTLTREKMITVMADAMRIEASQQVAYNYLPLSDSIWGENYAYLLKKHKVTKVEFEETMEYYKTHAKEFSSLMEEVVGVLDEEDNKEFRR
jgi:hypothetical protein